VPVERLTDLTDSRVAAYGSLADDARLRAAGLLVAEGRLVVRRVLENERFRVRSILVNDAAYASLLPQLSKLDARLPVFLCETAAFQPLTGHHIHRGCLALVERPRPTSLASLLDSSDWKRREPDSLIPSPETQGSRRTVLIALDGVGNPDNIGGVFRNAAAFSAAGVLLGPGCCDPLYRKAIRTSMAATLQVPHASIDDWPSALGLLRARGLTIAALSPREPAVSIDSFARSAAPAVALLVGTEGEGLSPELEAAADLRVRIPIAAGVDSLNLAVAVGIALHEVSSSLT
jgi:tRNA G18 (ribose-2'-O)-methylase SpoU